MLEDRIKGLHKEMIFLKDIFFAHASAQHNITDLDMDIKNILAEDIEPVEQWWQATLLLINNKDYINYFCTFILC